jgi:hypothetical protein
VRVSRTLFREPIDSHEIIDIADDIGDDEARPIDLHAALAKHVEGMVEHVAN